MTETIMLRGPFMWGTDMMRIVNRTSKIHHIQLHSQRYRNVGNTYTMLMKIQMQQFSFFFFSSANGKCSCRSISKEMQARSLSLALGLCQTQFQSNLEHKDAKRTMLGLWESTALKSCGKEQEFFFLANVIIFNISGASVVPT